MCGILGSVTARPGGRTHWVADALPALCHRGPDASGTRTFEDGPAAACELGHTRLRILDLSAAGDQPLGNEDGTVWTVFNGELYNFQELRAGLRRRGHAFRSTTDTEVIVHLYEEAGAELVADLRGMYAFAVWDTRTEELVLCRDRLGIKPLYYRVDGGTLRFASEARLLATRSALDVESVEAFLRLGWIPGPHTIHQDVRELPPGHVLRWRRGRVTLERHWRTRPAPPMDGPADDAELRAAALDAVRRQLVADVPVGIFLSSGVDSAIVARLASEAGGPVCGYTVAFDVGEDESAEAAALASRFGLGHTVVPVPSTEVPGSLDRIVADMDQPTVDGVNSWVISKAVREAGLTVALSGLGGDELLGGYSTFRHVPRLTFAGSAASRLPAPLRTSLIQAAGGLGRLRHSRGRRALEAVLAGGPGAAYASVRGLFGAAELAALWPGVPEGKRPLVDVRGARNGRSVDVGQLELGNYLPYQLLRDTDAASMAHSLEVRVPLLDDALVDLVLRSPGLTKVDLVRAVDPSLGWLAERRKRTFTLPFATWMQGPLRDPVRDGVALLADSALGFDGRALRELLASFDAGRAGWRPVWALAVLGMWLDRRPASAPPVTVGS